MKEEAEIENSSGDGEDRAGGTGTAVKYGVLGALAAVLCCVGPLVPILLGLGGATALFGLDRYTPLFFTLGLLILAGASWMAVRCQNRCCSVRSSARNIKTVALIFGVGIGAYLILQFAVVPTLASVASSKVAEARSGGSAIQGQALRLHVDGMTCAGCSVGVESALLDVPGVLSAKADWKTGYAWVTIGGTCVNVGCVPSKALIRAAEVLHRSNHHGFAGIDSAASLVDFRALTRQTSELVHTLRQQKYLDIVKDLPGVEIIEGLAHFLSEHEIAVGKRRIQADRVLIATGARTHVPDIPGLAETDYLIPDTAFALRELPKSLLVLGGRYIALECAQLFARLGVEVTVLQRSARILPTESPELTEQLTEALHGEGVAIHTDVCVKRVGTLPEGVCVEAEIDGKAQRIVAERLLLATGRTPNSEGLHPEAAGVRLTENGFIEVDDFLQTSAPGIYAAGDVVGAPMFVYTAAYEGALTAANACAESDAGRTQRDYEPLPWVVFTDPQVAGVGLDERQAEAAGIDAEAVTLPMDKVPRALVARQTTGFLQLIRDRGTDRILGGRALAHEGSEMMMEISLAIRHRMTARELASLFHPYLTLGEAVKLAALSFGKDVNKLSCCAT